MSQVFEVIVIQRTPSAANPAITDDKVIFGPQTILAASREAAIMWAGTSFILDSKIQSYDPRYIEVQVRPFAK